MVIYLIAIFLLIILYIIFPLHNNKQKKVLVTISMFPIFVILAFKNISIGADSLNYYNYFTIAKYSSLTELFEERMEKGYQIMIKVISFIFTNPQWQFVLVGLFLTISTGIFIYKYSKQPTLAILFYITLGLFAFNLTGIRQSIAMAICLFSFKYICDRKLVKFLTVIAIALLFHKSAIFFIPAYFIAYRKVNVKNTIINTIGAIVIMFIAEPLMLLSANLFDIEYGIEKTESGFIFYFIIIIITLLSLVYRKNLLKLNSNNLIFINLNFISAVLWGMRLISRTAERPSLYYLFASIILLEQILVTINEKQIRQILTLVAVFFSCALFIYRLLSTVQIYPYSFFWK